MNTTNGVVIAIAWPEFVGKQTGSWYDRPMQILGFNRNFHYQVGHASMVLINQNDKICRYFDCGRYNAPYQYGRIRDESTDSKLAINTKPVLEGLKILNIKEILNEIQQNPWSFGKGPLVASYCEINFESSFQKIKSMQDQGAIPFGPFIYNGTNCCRFVRTGILSGNPKLSLIRKFLLEFLWHLNPTPITNVNLLPNKTKAPTLPGRSPGKHHSLNAYTRKTVHGTLPQPVRHSNIPPNSQWLAGEVAGSWFHLIPEENGYRISRFSPEGIEECNGIFSLSNPESFDPEKDYEFIHLSHCSKVHILQTNQILKFERIS